MLAEVKIHDDEYNTAQQTLINLWESHCKTVENTGIDLGFITFTNKAPKRPKTMNRRIAGLQATCISYLSENRELVRMDIHNFLLLMAKTGINIEIIREIDGGMSQEMICDLCGKNLHPLDAHFGKLEDKLTTAHIDCWNKRCEELGLIEPKERETNDI